MSKGVSKLEFFLKSVGYPERMPKASSPFVMRVDGMEILAEESAGRIFLSFALTDDASQIPMLASYAAGRMLREDAVLTYGRMADAGAQGGDEGPCAFLWQSAPADADGHVFMRFFETFMDSCDWWRERVDVLRGGAPDGSSVPATMMIRP